jgi:hypothetical protein
VTDSLFDDLEEVPPSEPLIVDRPRWREVPQALFLSWAPAMQLAYCAARDEDAALDATSDEEMEWLLERAMSYRRMMQSC